MDSQEAREVHDHYQKMLELLGLWVPFLIFGILHFSFDYFSIFLKVELNSWAESLQRAVAANWVLKTFTWKTYICIFESGEKCLKLTKLYLKPNVSL